MNNFVFLKQNLISDYDTCMCEVGGSGLQRKQWE